MNLTSIANVFGTLLIVTGSSMLLPAVCSFYYGEDDLFAILISALIIVCAGIPFKWFFRNENQLGIKDGIFPRLLWLGGHIDGLDPAVFLSWQHPFTCRCIF